VPSIVGDAKATPFDPAKLPNPKILTYVDILQRFVPDPAVRREDLYTGILTCVEALANDTVVYRVWGLCRTSARPSSRIPSGGKICIFTDHGLRVARQALASSRIDRPP
jgi:hypothetical protein